MLKEVKVDNPKAINIKALIQTEILFNELFSRVLLDKKLHYILSSVYTLGGFRDEVTMRQFKKRVEIYIDECGFESVCIALQYGIKHKNHADM